MDADDLGDLVLPVMRLRLAAWDMESAARAARSIPLPAYHDVREELATAFAVAYARTFTRSNAGLALGKAGLPDDLQSPRGGARSRTACSRAAGIVIPTRSGSARGVPGLPGLVRAAPRLPF